MTEFTPPERRVASNSTKLQKAEEAIREAEMGIDKLLDAWEDICSLSEYMESGQWQEDFEADERGEISPSIYGPGPILGGGPRPPIVAYNSCIADSVGQVYSIKSDLAQRPYCYTSSTTDSCRVSIRRTTCV